MSTDSQFQMSVLPRNLKIFIKELFATFDAIFVKLIYQFLTSNDLFHQIQELIYYSYIIIIFQDGNENKCV